MRIAIVAGEASGDLLGAELLRAIRVRHPDAQVEGIGGPQMQAEGCVPLYPMDRLSVLGLFETFGRYPELLPVRARLARYFIAKRPDIFIGIDAPDFNLELARRLRQGGIATAHYVSPSVWAWRRYRIRRIAQAVDLMLVLFPFEADFYRKHRVPAVFVGHPLADLIPDEVDAGEARRKLGIAEAGEIVALLPGSRVSEIAYLARPMMRTARWLAQRRGGIRFLVPLAGTQVLESFQRQRELEGRDLDLQVVPGRSYEAMAAADAVLVASGTASLEAMLLKRPMVITYKTMGLSFSILKFWVGSNIPYVGLPNLLAGRQLVPELLQEQAVPERLGPALLNYLEDESTVVGLRREFAQLHARLRRGASERAADAVLELVAQRPCQP